MNRANRGILTMAFGEPKYLRLAETLARSLARHAPDVPRAVVTDSPQRLMGHYDLIVPMRPELGGGFLQKLHMPSYSPFEQTMFVDSDVIAVSDFSFLWPLLAEKHIAMSDGRTIRDGFWYGDVATILDRMGVEEVQVFNSGLVFFDRSPEAEAVFADARELLDCYDEFGIRPFRGGPADEPMLAFALARRGMRPVIHDGGRGMRTPLGITGPLDVDALGGHCRFLKEGQAVEPSLVHFCSPFWDGFFDGLEYRRESRKLWLAEHLALSPQTIGPAVNRLTGRPFAAIRRLRPVSKRARVVKARVGRATARAAG